MPDNSAFRDKEFEELQKQKEEIEQEKQKQLQQNDMLQNELQTKEQALEMEKNQKDELTKLIAEMEKKLVQGGHGMDGLDEQNKEQIRKERILQK